MIYEENYKVLNCLDELTFSKTHSENRLKKAYSLLGENLINKIIGFTFFLLGANRKQIAEKINIPIGTFLSFLTRINNIGISAFGDRRSSTSFQLKQAKSQKKEAKKEAKREVKETGSKKIHKKPAKK